MAEDLTTRILRDVRNEMREMRAEARGETGAIFEALVRIERRLISLAGAVPTHGARLDELEAEGD